MLIFCLATICLRGQSLSGYVQVVHENRFRFPVYGSFYLARNDLDGDLHIRGFHLQFG
jgi:hypothetical protein